MILRSVTFTDFGVYGGTQTLDLAPDAEGSFDRPIVLFRGKNGVGKTTLVEGVRLALHGPLALGPRVSRKAYEHHLRRRIHRPAGADADAPDAPEPPTEAVVRVVLDFVRGGERHTYTVTRSWRSTGIGLVEHVAVLEDGEPPSHVAADDYNAFLRELVPAVAGDLFFFDGEKIDRLVDDGAADEALGQAIEQLLGLHLVALLDTDLGVYVDRALDRADRTAAEGELAEARELRDRLAEEARALSERVDEAQDALTATLAEVQRREQELASEGGAYAEKYEGLKETKKRLQLEIEGARRRLIELASGVLPFALAPNILRDTLGQMDDEARLRDAQAVADLVQRQRKQVRQILESDETYERLDARLAAGKRKQLTREVLAVFFDPSEDVVEAEDVYLHASDYDRELYAAWRAEAVGPVGAAVRDAAADFAAKEKALTATEEALAKVPPDLILQPIIEALSRLRDRQAEQEAALDALVAEAATARFKLEKAENRLARAHAALRSGEGADGKIRLAIRTREAFADYAATLRARKVRAFADVVLDRFNALCRKAHLLDRVEVAPDTFAVTLHRDGQAFGRSELSAGEKQLFAVSALWALREVSEVPMPVVVDTPLGRLDRDHRLAMVRTFFPHVAHQVILLATDTEVDRALAAEVAPAVSHGYRMAFDGATGSTSVERFSADELAEGAAELADPEGGDGAADGLIELDVLPSA
jgi:DNA sulfur modification protein DndD